MSSELQYVPSERQGKNLYLDGYIYQTIRTSAYDVVYWRCKENRGVLKCPSKCATKDGNIITTPSKHNHQAPSKEKIVFNSAISKAKDRLKNEKRNSVRSIFVEEINKAIIQSDLEINSKTSQFAPDFAKARSRLYKIRQKSLHLPDQPKSLDDFEIPLNIKTKTNGERFLLFESNDENCIL